MNRAHTQIQKQTKFIRQLKGFRTGISLHSHTNHSKENLGFLPHYIDFLRTQFVTRMLKSGLERYEKSKGKTLDFHRAYWTPPVTPGMVLASETDQIEQKLQLAALVSITDHDTIDGPLALQAQPASATMSVSVEWTVPFDGDTFHVGVHHLPPERSVEIMSELALYTKEPSEEKLGDLFSLLANCPETLLVLNHPLQNIQMVRGNKHLTSLRRFLARCRPWIHALEFNGMRSPSENHDVLQMAEEYDLPIVAGGDRHGSRPNTVLNLSQAETWSDFVAGIRCDRRNAIVMLPAYQEPAPLRELATAHDVLRHYPHHPYGKRRFTDRIFFNLEGYGWHPISFYWDGGDGKPKWLNPAVMAVVALGSDHLRPIMNLLFSRPSQFDRILLPQRDDEAREIVGTRAELPVEPE